MKKKNFFAYNFLIFEKCFLVGQLRWNLRDDLVTANWAYRNVVLKIPFANVIYGMFRAG